MSNQTSISGAALFRALRGRGYDFFSGVPCSLFEGFYPVLESQEEAPLISAVREDDALRLQQIVAVLSGMSLSTVSRARSFFTRSPPS